MAQNGTSNRTGLPHGKIPIHQIADLQAREAIMKLSENVLSLAKRLSAAEAKLINAERR